MLRIIIVALVFGIVVFAALNVFMQILLETGILTQGDVDNLFPGSIVFGIVAAVAYFRVETWKSPADVEAEERFMLNMDIE